jgi:hypothetical protein
VITEEMKMKKLSEHSPVPYLCAIFLIICFLAISCKESKPTRPSIISDNITRTTVGEFDWPYLESPDGVCYQVLIMVDVSGTHGFGYMAMSEVPHSFCENQ